MAAWERLDAADQPGFILDYARIWRAAEKIVYSSRLEAALSAKTRIERAFDPDAVSRMKAESTTDLTVGGPHLATHAFAADLVDECQVFIAPITVGGGKAAFPAGAARKLALEGQRRFDNGVVFLRYRVVA